MNDTAFILIKYSVFIGVNSLHEKTVVIEESMQYFTEYEQLHIMDKVNVRSDHTFLTLWIKSGTNSLRRQIVAQSLR